MLTLETFKHLLKQQLKAPLPGRESQMQMAARHIPQQQDIPDTAKPSAVLIILFPKEAEIMVIFIQRTDDGKAHGGQISFPGGRQDPEDESLQATALREAEEEVGIKAKNLEMLGALTPLYIPVSNYVVHPFVAWANTSVAYAISENEVVEVLEIPLTTLRDMGIKVTTTVRPSSHPGLALEVPAYKLPGNKILWGATAMIYAELADCLNLMER